MKRLIISALLTTPLLSLADTGNLISNGSFESTVQTKGTWAIYNTITGWTTGSRGVEVRNNVVGSALDGSNFVELDTTANSSISQSFATIAGALYELSFAYATRSGTNVGTNGINWQLSGANLSGEVGKDGNTSWTTYTTSFTGTGSLMTLSFSANGRSDSLGTSLDAVSVTQLASVSAVPEPESYAMMLAGLGAIGMLVHRRRRKD